jgi:hypothetical protein
MSTTLEQTQVDSDSLASRNQREANRLAYLRGYVGNALVSAKRALAQIDTSDPGHVAARLARVTELLDDAAQVLASREYDENGWTP